MEGQRLPFEITANDGLGPDPPYSFEVWARPPYGNATLILQEPVPPSTSTFYWNNNQPAGRFVQFRLTDRSGRTSTSDAFQVAPAGVTQVVTQTVLATLSTGAAPAPTGSIPASLTTTSGAQATNSSSTPGPIKTNLAAIAGGVVGGVLVLAAITAALVLFLQRRRRKSPKSLEKADFHASNITIVPFVYEDPYQNNGTQSESHSGPSRSHTGASDAPPVYSPPSDVTPYADTPLTSPRPSTSDTRVFSDRKGAYAPVSTTAH